MTAAQKRAAKLAEEQAAATAAAELIPHEDDNSQSSILATSTVQDWMKEEGFVRVSPDVRVNSNGYPFVTFTTADRVGENVYFSKKAGIKYSAGDMIEKGFFKDLQIVIVANADGEERTKLSTRQGLTISELF